MTRTPASPRPAARLAVGTLFVLTGAFKMVLWPRFFAFCDALAPQVLAGTALLAPARAALFLTALIVPPLEVGGGVLLWRGQRVRAASTLLALDMLGAILSVGVPGRLGRSTEMAGHKIGSEPWRLPLEIVLMLLCVWLALRHQDTRRDEEEVG